eukprot:1559186-Amphidinium_carterae.1
MGSICKSMTNGSMQGVYACCNWHVFWGFLNFSQVKPATRTPNRRGTLQGLSLPCSALQVLQALLRNPASPE